MWLSAIKLAVSAGSKIYANRQKAKVAMSDAQLLHAERQARGEEAYLSSNISRHCRPGSVPFGSSSSEVFLE